MNLYYHPNLEKKNGKGEEINFFLLKKEYIFVNQLTN